MENLNIEKLIFINKKFFKEEEFIENLSARIYQIKKQLHLLSEKEIRDGINELCLICYHRVTNKKLRLQMHVMFIELFLYYADKYPRKSVYEKILLDLENENFKQRMRSGYVYASKLYMARTLYGLFNASILENKMHYTEENTQILFKAKANLKALFIRYTENKSQFSSQEITDVLVLLAAILAQILRWNEALFYLQQIPQESEYSIAYKNYYSAFLLDSIKAKTCLNYNALLQLKIIDSAAKGKESAILSTLQQGQLSDLERSTRSFLRKNKIKIPPLRKHQKKVTKSNINPPKYVTFVRSKNLYLNEHSYFCTCKQSMCDNLSIETSHNHTKIEWLNNYQFVLEKIIADFIVSRNEYYFSLDNTHLQGHQLKYINSKPSFRKKYKDALLLTSFKSCYSILDTIATTIVNALESENLIERKNNQTPQEKVYYQNMWDIYEYRELIEINNKRPYNKPVYFLNMWDIFEFKEDIIMKNPFLMSLKSIALDLDRSKLAALSGFKKIRNAIEHETIIIGLKEENPNIKALHISKEELEKKMDILLNLTKSAIFNYTYFFRAMSISKSKECK